MNSTELFDIQILNLSGQVVSQAQMNNGATTMDLTALSDGVYMVYAVSQSGAIVEVQKLILTKQ